MQWDLALPLLVMGATLVVMAWIAVAAKKMLFDPRRDDHSDDGAEPPH